MGLAIERGHCKLTSDMVSSVLEPMVARTIYEINTTMTYSVFDIRNKEKRKTLLKSCSAATIQVVEKKSTFEIVTNEMPVGLVIDPEYWMLFEEK